MVAAKDAGEDNVSATKDTAATVSFGNTDRFMAIPLWLEAE